MEQLGMGVRGSHIRNRQRRGLITKYSPPGGRPPTTSPYPSPSPTCAPTTSATYAMFYVMHPLHPGLIMVRNLMPKKLPSTWLNIVLIKAADQRRNFSLIRERAERFFQNGCGLQAFGNFGNLQSGQGKIRTAKNGPHAGAGLWRSCSYICYIRLFFVPSIYKSWIPSVSE